jgi:hypothetical protein
MTPERLRFGYDSTIRSSARVAGIRLGRASDILRYTTPKRPHQLHCKDSPRRGNVAAGCHGLGGQLRDSRCHGNKSRADSWCEKSRRGRLGISTENLAMLYFGNTL